MSRASITTLAAIAALGTTALAPINALALTQPAFQGVRMAMPHAAMPQMPAHLPATPSIVHANLTAPVPPNPSHLAVSHTATPSNLIMHQNLGSTPSAIRAPGATSSQLSHLLSTKTMKTELDIPGVNVPLVPGLSGSCIDCSNQSSGSSNVPPPSQPTHANVPPGTPITNPGPCVPSLGCNRTANNAPPAAPMPAPPPAPMPTPCKTGKNPCYGSNQTTTPSPPTPSPVFKGYTTNYPHTAVNNGSINTSNLTVSGGNQPTTPTPPNPVSGSNTPTTPTPPTPVSGGNKPTTPTPPTPVSGGNKPQQGPNGQGSQGSAPSIPTGSQGPQGSVPSFPSGQGSQGSGSSIPNLPSIPSFPSTGDNSGQGSTPDGSSQPQYGSGNGQGSSGPSGYGNSGGTRTAQNGRGSAYGAPTFKAIALSWNPNGQWVAQKSVTLDSAATIAVSQCNSQYGECGLSDALVQPVRFACLAVARGNEDPTRLFAAIGTSIDDGRNAVAIQLAQAGMTGQVECTLCNN
jgi:hypothetical protein